MMSSNQGTFTLTPGTGSKSVNIGAAPDWAEIYFQGSAIKVGWGSWHGGNQFAFADPSSSSTSGRFFIVKNTSGTTILEGEISGLSGTTNIDFYIYTQSGTVPQAFIKFGNY